MIRRGSLNYVLMSFLFDMLCTLQALSLAATLRVIYPFDEKDLAFLHLPAPAILLTLLIWATTFVLFSVYDDQKTVRFIDEAQKVFIASLFSVLLLAGALYFSYRDIPRLFVVYFSILNVLLLIGWRVAARLLFHTFGGSQRVRNVVLVGNNDLSREIAQTIGKYRWSGLNLIGVVDNHARGSVNGLPVLGDLSDLRAIVTARDVEEVVIALPYSEYEALSSICIALQSIAVNVRIVPNYLNLALHRATVESFGGLPLINMRDPALTRYQRLVKRSFDVLCSAVLILLTLPVIVAVAIAIRLDSPGPVLFRQKRVGENGRLFTMYKFRSMVADAEKRQAEVNRLTADGKLLHKSENDPRITRVGSFIRRTSLDELPQLFNVLLGDMSLVGPRPELPWLVENYEPWQHKRFAVPQGITGWWQVNGRSDKPMHLNTEDDLYYIQHYSLLLDLRILWKTAAVVMKREGAY